MMGMGKGGVPGSSTLASAMFALLAPRGFVSQMMALVVPITMMTDVLVGITYFRDAKWKVAGQMLVWTGIGIFLGMQLSRYLSDDMIRRSIGMIFVAVAGNQIYSQFTSKSLSESEKTQRMELLQSLVVVAPYGIVGGIASYISNNMGPMLNIYLLALNLDKYSLIGTRSAIFMSINFLKFFMRWGAGDISLDGIQYGFVLGLFGCIGVVLAKMWIANASDELFKFIYERVTVAIVSFTGTLLIAGLDLKTLLQDAVALVTDFVVTRA